MAWKKKEKGKKNENQKLKKIYIKLIIFIM